MAVTSVSIPSGSSTASFYYGDTQAGTPTITASASGLNEWHPTRDDHGRRREILEIHIIARLGAPSASATLGQITVTEYDQFGNLSTTAETVGLDFVKCRDVRVRLIIERNSRQFSLDSERIVERQLLLRRYPGRHAHNHRRGELDSPAPPNKKRCGAIASLHLVAHGRFSSGVERSIRRTTVTITGSGIRTSSSTVSFSGPVTITSRDRRQLTVLRQSP